MTATQGVLHLEWASEVGVVRGRVKNASAGRAGGVLDEVAVDHRGLIIAIADSARDVVGGVVDEGAVGEMRVAGDAAGGVGRPAFDMRPAAAAAGPGVIAQEHAVLDDRLCRPDNQPSTVTIAAAKGADGSSAVGIALSHDKAIHSRRVVNRGVGRRLDFLVGDPDRTDGPDDMVGIVGVGADGADVAAEDGLVGDWVAEVELRFSSFETTIPPHIFLHEEVCGA